MCREFFVTVLVPHHMNRRVASLASPATDGAPGYNRQKLTPSPREERVGRRSGSTGIELSRLRWTWSAEFIPFPADFPVPWASGLKSALLNSTAVGLGRGAFNKIGLRSLTLSSCAGGGVDFVLPGGRCSKMRPATGSAINSLCRNFFLPSG